MKHFFQQHPTCFQPSPVAESHHVNNSNVTRHLVVYRTEVQSQSLAKLLNSKTCNFSHAYFTAKDTYLRTTDI